MTPTSLFSLRKVSRTSSSMFIYEFLYESMSLIVTTLSTPFHLHKMQNKKLIMRNLKKKKSITLTRKTTQQPQIIMEKYKLKISIKIIEHNMVKKKIEEHHNHNHKNN